jgi:type I restriction enzyme M protein
VRISQQQLESYLWGAATLLRGTIDAADYKQFIFPLLFYKRLCDVFDEETQTALKESGGDAAFAAYPENHRFQIPPAAHWREVRRVAKNIGAALQSAMRAIEAANPDKLYGISGDAQWTNKDRLSDAMLRDLVEHFSSLELTVANLPEDELGQGYEYLIKKFADDSGHTAAEFYTNRTVVHLMTEMLEPQPGESIYDPTCGSGGMLLSCIAYLRRQGKEWRNVRLYGQERNLMTSSIARMNCFLHGIEDFRIERGDTLSEPKFVQGDRLQRFDVVLANPPYSIKQWDREAFASDPWGRNLYGTPPQGRADYAFWQHILSSLAPNTGRCAILFPHGVLFRQEEAEMRRKLIEADLIECVLGLGPNLFYNSPMEACVVVCRTVKPNARKGRILFVNAVNEVTRERAQSFLTDDHIERIVMAYRAFKDSPGFTRVVQLEEIRAKGHNLSIPLYVPLAAASSNGEKVGDSDLPAALAGWLESSAHVRASVGTLCRSGVAIPRVNPDWAKLLLFQRKSWTRVRFGDVVESLNETVGNPADLGLERFVGLDHVEPGSLHIRAWGNVADGTTFTRRCRPGQVLFGKRRAYQRKVALAEFEAVVSGDIYVLAAKNDSLLPELLPFICLSERFFRHAVGTSAGSLSPRTNWRSLASFEFALPPVDKQQRISEVLWAIDDLLTKNWAVQRDIKTLRKADIENRIRVAGESANRLRISQLAPPGEEALKTGPFGSKLSAECFAPRGIPIINIAAIGDANIEEQGLLFLKPSLASEFRSYSVLKGDVVFSRVAEIGRCMVIDEQQSGSIISSNLIRIRVDPEKIAPLYMLLLLRFCAETRNQIRQFTSTGGRMLVNTKLLSKLTFAVPDRIRQDEVIERAKQFDLRLHQHIEAARLTSALAKELRKAFF